MASKSLPQQSLIGGIGSHLRNLFKGAKQFPRDKDGKQPTSKLDPGFPENQDIEDKIKYLGWRYFRESSFEKIQFARKWMRNALMFQGYHELEWSEINVAWEAIVRDSGDYAFPNNHYRSKIMDGASLYVKNAPQFNVAPVNEDFENQAVAEATNKALKVIQENVKYDYLRTLEAINLRLFGNSFRYSYYSIDPRYGFVSSPVYEQAQTVIQPAMFQCPQCGLSGPTDATQMACPQCGNPQLAFQDAVFAKVPKQVGTTKYPRGQEITEVINPLEVYVRSNASDLWHAPFVIRGRIVDRLGLQAQYSDVDLGLSYGGDSTSGSAYEASQDLSLIYQQSLADLPGDPTQFAAWYERATSYAKSLFLQGWFRPSLYSFDPEMKKKFPDGLYCAITGDKLLESRNESLDDHWVHIPYIPVPGRFWGDGDDDLVPKQLQLNENERLILRNQAYNSVPQTVIDPMRIDPDSIVNDPGEVIQAKNMGGRPVKDAIETLRGQELPQETWMWRESILRDMEYHSGVFGAAIGEHQPGVNTMGGQMQMASRTEMTLSPLLLMYKECNELWARQVLKIAAENWLDERVAAIEGINGNWEFTKLKGSMMQLDEVKITANLMPVDYGQQQALNEAVASGLLNPQDPRVQRKALELYQLPTELNTFSGDAKVQWKEIEKMKQGQPVQPVLLRDDDGVHIQICRVWLNSDEAEKMPPQVVAAVYQHMQAHVINSARMQQMQQAVNQSAAEVGASITGQPVQPGQEGQGQPGQGGQPGQQPQGAQGGQSQQNPQAGQRGGQVPQSSVQRHQRAVKGQAAKPNRPQPTSGNQYHRRPV